MFKLTVSFENLVALTAFVNKMGADVQGGTISHDQPIVADKAPAKKGSSRKATAKVEEEVVLPEQPSVTQAPATPFTNFAPGAGIAQAPTAPVAQPAPAVAQPVASTPAMAMPQAPVMQAPAPAPAPEPVVSPERQQWNDACIQLVNHLQTHAPAKGLVETQLAQIIANSFVEAGCPANSKISKITDQQIQAFYPVLHKNVTAALS